jgi:hypothetical protein
MTDADTEKILKKLLIERASGARARAKAAGEAAAAAVINQDEPDIESFKPFFRMYRLVSLTPLSPFRVK